MPAFRLVRDGAPLPAARVHRGDRLAARPLRRAGARRPRGGRVRGRGDDRAPGAAPALAPGRALLPRARAARSASRSRRTPTPRPPSARGFAVHHDTHDVFVLQVSGVKRWRIYDPVVELPLGRQRWSGGAGEPVEELTLEPGDTLYLPRGWPHEAVAQDADSLHLTIGLHPPTRLDALRAALEECGDDVEFRRGLGEGELPPDAARAPRRPADAGGGGAPRAATLRRLAAPDPRRPAHPDARGGRPGRRRSGRAARRP